MKIRKIKLLDLFKDQQPEQKPENKPQETDIKPWRPRNYLRELSIKLVKENQ